MSSGMNLEEAKEYAKTMTYTEAVLNTQYAKGIAFKKATRIKLYELAEIADRLDGKTEQTEPSGYKMKPIEQTEPSDTCKGCIYDNDENVLACVACVLKEKQTDCSWK